MLTSAQWSAVTTAALALDLDKWSLGEAGCEMERREENQKQEKDLFVDTRQVGDEQRGSAKSWDL